MRPFLRALVALLLLGCLPAALAQSRSASTAQTLIVLPFENESKAPGLEWIGEAFPEVIGRRLASPMLYVVSRQDRQLAFDRAGVPANVHLTRATLYRIVEQMDADYVVLGDFNFDGQTFTGKAQLMDMKRLNLSAPVSESGPLVKIIDVQTALAWDLLKLMRAPGLPSREVFLAAMPAIRLDAFENYVRGITSTSQTDAIRHFREAVRLNPDYTLAILQLGRSYFETRDYEQAANWLARVPKDDPAAREASFYLGLSQYYLGDFAKAEAAFGFLLSRLPLTEVYNNLGVAEARRGKRAALEHFQRAVTADPNDADYHFNLAVALYRANDFAGAARQLRETLALRPNDAEARTLLDGMGSNVAAAMKLQEAKTAPKLPLERIKRNYDESSFEMLALEIQNTIEMRLSQTDPHTHAEYHVRHGRELLQQGFSGEAEKDFREAVLLDPTSSGAHSGLARVLELTGDNDAARREADAAVRLGPSAEALLVLARLDVKNKQDSSAAAHVDAALALEPNNSAALALKRSLESTAGRSQPQ